MAVFVDMSNSELDQAKELVDFLHGLREEGADAGKNSTEKALLEARNLPVLVQSLAADFHLSFKKCEPAQIEGIFNLLCAFLRNLDEGQQDAFLKTLLSQITANVEAPSLGLKLLNNFFNTFNEKSAKRFEILKAILAFAKATGQTQVLLPHLSKTDKWIEAWSLNAAGQRELYRAICDFFGADDSAEALAFQVKYLRTFNGDSAEAKGTARAEAASAVAKIAALDSIYVFDEYVELEVMQTLKDDPKFAPMHELLQIVTRGRVKDYVDFDAKNGNYVSNSFGLSSETLLRRMRILTLAALGCQHKVVPFAQVTSELRITEDEIVEWVFEASSVGALEGKLDELENAVIVLRAKHRLFEKEHWVKLQADLHVCQQNLSHMMNVIDKNTINQHIAAAK